MQKIAIIQHQIVLRFFILLPFAYRTKVEEKDFNIW